jgi:hypothetical protein
MKRFGGRADGARRVTATGAGACASASERTSALPRTLDHDILSNVAKPREESTPRGP